MRHLAVSTRFTNRLEDRYVPVKHKLRAIRDLRPWGKLHLAQFSTTWKLDWELTIDEPTFYLLDLKHRKVVSIRIIEESYETDPINEFRNPSPFFRIHHRNLEI